MTSHSETVTGNYFGKPPPEVPHPEGAEEKELYAFFGLCAYSAQVLERGLINLAIVLHAKGLSPITLGAIETMLEQCERKTLGQLLASIRHLVRVPSGLESALATALNDRNDLAHHFFSRHDSNFVSERGRIVMLTELRAMTTRFIETDYAVEAMALPLWAHIGISRDMLEREVARMMAAAESPECSS